MQEYEDTLKDIESTIGIVPGFMKALRNGPYSKSTN
jgi:hypothetical protein